jgi:ammonia channel protein AmtB
MPVTAMPVVIMMVAIAPVSNFVTPISAAAMAVATLHCSLAGTRSIYERRSSTHSHGTVGRHIYQ